MRIVRDLLMGVLSPRVLLDALPDPVCIVKDGRIALLNRAALEVFASGPGSNAWVGQPLDALVHPDDRGRALEQIGSSVATTKVAPTELRMVRHDGTHVDVDVTAKPAVFGSEQAIVVVARDLSVRKESRKQLMVAERMASVSMLAAGVAHEINNPLASVLANVEFVLESLHSDDGDVLLALTELRESALRIKEVVLDLKVTSRSEASAPHGPVDVSTVFESCLRLAAGQTARRARLVRHFERVSAVEGNVAQLGQVLSNLIVHALLQMPDGCADQNELRVATRMNGETVVIEISDTGAGISAEGLEAMFTPLFTIRQLAIGTGTSLAICSEIIEAMGGELRVASQLGVGTTFTVTLPAAH